MPASPINEFQTLGDLKAAAAGVAGRSMVTGALTLLLGDLNKRMRVRQMLAEYTATGSELPDDFLEAETLKVGGTPYTATTDQNPTYCGFSIQNGTVIANPEGEIWLRYYQKIQFTDDTDQSAVMDAYPDVFFYGLLWQHGRAVRDESAQAWGAAYSEALDAVLTADQASRASTAIHPAASLYQ